MPHNLAITNGKTAFCYCGEAPWHGLGQKLDAPVTALRVFFTPVRVVCQNTLAMAERQGKRQGISILHKGNLEAKIRAAQRVLGLAQRFYDDAAAHIDRLANVYPTQAQLTTYFAALYPDPEEGKDNHRAVRVREELQRLFEEGTGLDMPQIKHSAWAAYNAVTEWVDHRRPRQGDDDPQRASRRLQSIWWGGGAKVKDRAWNLALEMASSN